MYSSNPSVSRVLRGPALPLSLALLLAVTTGGAIAGDLTGQTITLRGGSLGSGGSGLLEHSSPTRELHVEGAAIGQPLPVWSSEAPSGLRLVSGFSAAAAVSDLLRDDADGDEVPTLRDNCPDDFNPDQADQEGDGVGDVCDNCVATANGSLIPDAGGNVQLDVDGDEIGNMCDCDFNNDGGCGQPDYSILLACFGQSTGAGTGPADDPTCEESDMNGDGGVGQPDYSLFLTRFGQTPGP